MHVRVRVGHEVRLGFKNGISYTKIESGQPPKNAAKTLYCAEHRLDLGRLFTSSLLYSYSAGNYLTTERRYFVQNVHLQRNKGKIIIYLHTEF